MYYKCTRNFCHRTGVRVAREDREHSYWSRGYSQSPQRAWPCLSSSVPRCVVGALGVVAVARLYLTLPRTIPRLRVLILISPFKFLWQRHMPTFHRPGLCYALAVLHAEDERFSLFTPPTSASRLMSYHANQS